MTTGGFDEPTRADFDRALSQLAHDQLEAMMRAKLEVTDIFIKAGGLQASRFPVTVADRFDQIYRAFLVTAADRAAIYVGRLGDPRLLATYLRPHLEWLRDRGLDQIPEELNMKTELYNKYKASLTPRLEAVLRDLEIGVVNGKTIAASAGADEIFQLKPGAWGFNVNLKALWRAVSGWRKKKT